MPRLFIGDIPLDDLPLEGVLRAIDRFIEERTPHHVITLNSLMYLYSRDNPVLRQSLALAHLLIPDSIGITLASKFINGVRPHRLPGIDLMLELCGYAAEKNRGIYLLGSRPEVAGRTASCLKDSHPGLRINGCHHGYFSREEEDAVIESVNSSNADILFVALNVPEQEIWIHRNIKRLGVPVVMGVGGSFDVISGGIKRAPALVRRLGTEWLYRLLLQPWRLPRIMDLPRFVISILKLKYGS